MKSWILEQFFPELVAYLRMQRAFGDAGASDLLELYDIDVKGGSRNNPAATGRGQRKT